ncbi:MAG: HAD family phosphatase [Candidatus Aminicenantes bacterium]|nr:HAD family phosphatase [Candidatus Aminicenantes bacterium]
MTSTRFFPIPNGMRMLVCDLDGTLLHRDRTFHQQDIRILKEIGCMGITRVIATGRSLHSLRNAIPNDFPVDHVVFSSGAGIMDWPGQQLVYQAGMALGRAKEIIKVLDQRRLNHMIHRRVPHNHWFWYSRFTNESSDFSHRLRRYRAFARVRPESPNRMGLGVSQFIVIVPPLKNYLNRLRCVLGSSCHIIRATSPLDNRSMWIELMPRGVSKAAGIEELCRRGKIPLEATVGLGNDYNDLDMLRTVGRAAVTVDAPEMIRREFPSVSPGKGGILRALLHDLNQSQER